jgi:hypothetical protein
MINARFVPIETWPQEKTKSWNRKANRFKVKYSRTLDELERELNHLRAKDVIIQVALSRDDIRNDGWPRADARFREPGVIVSFRGQDGTEIAFPCDTYDNWQANLRAISLTLSALRDINRYGVTKHNEQYKGWAKLPPAPKRMNPHEALDFVKKHSGYVAIDKETWSASYRSAAFKLHPDRETGSHDQFVVLQHAAEIIQEAYGW